MKMKGIATLTRLLVIECLSTGRPRGFRPDFRLDRRRCAGFHRRGRSRCSRNCGQCRDECLAQRGDQRGRRIFVSIPATWNLYGQGREDRLQDRDPQPDRVAGAVSGSRRFRTADRTGQRIDRSARRRGSAGHRQRNRGHGHREQAHRGAAAERAQLSAVGFARPERFDGLLQPGTGRRAAGRHSGGPDDFGGRTAHQFQPLHAGRRRKHGPEFQHLRGDAIDRRAAGIQGADRRLSGGVRPADHADQRADQVGHEPVSRHPVRVSPQRQDGRQSLFLHFDPDHQGSVQVEPVRLHAGRPGAACRRFSTARTSSSSWGTTNPTGNAATRPVSIPWRRWPCRAETSRQSPARIYDPNSHALAADGKTITATLFPGNILPQNRISPISKKLLEFYRTPTLARRGQQLRHRAGPSAKSRPVCPAHGLRGVVEIDVGRPL